MRLHWVMTTAVSGCPSTAMASGFSGTSDACTTDAVAISAATGANLFIQTFLDWVDGAEKAKLMPARDCPSHRLLSDSRIADRSCAHRQRAAMWSGARF